MELRRSERLRLKRESNEIVHDVTSYTNDNHNNHNNHNNKKFKGNLDNNDNYSNSDNMYRNIWEPISSYRAPKTSKYVSATAIRNYMLNDPLIDWLELYYISTFNECERVTEQEKLIEEKNKINVLLENGLKFENAVVNDIKKRFKNECVQVADNHYDLNEEKMQLTLSYMNSGIPIILQAVLINKDNKTHGIADIIIRSDYVNKFMKYNENHLDDDEIYINAPALNMTNFRNLHYVVVDIKWTTLHLCADGILIRNDNRIPAYKGQLAIYNCALGYMQGYTPNKAFLLGHSWKYETCGDKFDGNSCFDLFGHIDYSYFDKEYITKTRDAIEWVHDVRNNGSKWTVIPPSNKYLYPNMSNHNDTPWTEVKKIIANSIEELTQLWMVGSSNREIGHSNDIYKWSDERCCANLLGVTGPKRSVVLDKIIDINHSQNELISPKRIKDNTSNWQTENKDDYYVDFETANGCFLSEPKTCENMHDNNIIFMIGCGYCENNKWYFKQFTAKDINVVEEKRIISEWKDFIVSRSKTRIARFFHWSNAEVTTMKFANIRNNYKWNNIVWIDLCKIFQNEPIVVKGALSFKLKDISKNMYKHNMIKTTWPNNGITDGLGAMIDAIKHYKDSNSNIINEIAEYNEVDCKVMWEIVRYCRLNLSR